MTGSLAGDPLSAPSASAGVLRDARGRQLLLRGVNLSQRSKNPPFRGWLEPRHVQLIQSLGADHVRFLLTWEAIEPQDGVFDDTYLAAMAEEISWFEASGIQVVLDMHQDQFARPFAGDGFPLWMILTPDPFPQIPDVMAPFPLNYLNPKVDSNFQSFYEDATKRARLASAWAHAVSVLGESKAVIGYDLMNEPWPAYQDPLTFEATTLTTLEAELGQAIRAQDPSRIIFFEPWLQAGLLPTTGVHRPNGDPNACYAPHWYDPAVDLRASLGIAPAYDGNATRTAEAFARLQDQAQGLGTALWLGEYGIERARGGALQYLEDHRRLLDANLMSGCIWDFDPAEPELFTCVDESGIMQANAPGFAHPHPRAVAGTLVSTSFDPTTHTLEVVWQEGHLGPDAPTIIELPRILYPCDAALEVTLSDAPGSWTSVRETQTGRLLVEADPSEPVHTLVVKPR
jgi:endoglycosylceramidase